MLPSKYKGTKFYSYSKKNEHKIIANCRIGIITNLSTCQSVKKKGRGVFLKRGVDFPYNKKYKIYFLLYVFIVRGIPPLDSLTD